MTFLFLFPSFPLDFNHSYCPRSFSTSILIISFFSPPRIPGALSICRNLIPNCLNRSIPVSAYSRNPLIVVGRIPIAASSLVLESINHLLSFKSQDRLLLLGCFIFIQVSSTFASPYGFVTRGLYRQTYGTDALNLVISHTFLIAHFFSPCTICIFTMAMNSTLVSDLPPLPPYTLVPRPPLVAGIPDNILALILPIVAYWVVSMFFHLIDVYDIFPQYRLHTPAEVSTRNRVSRWDVVRDVVLQQVVQTIAGLIMAYFDELEYIGREEHDVAVWARRIRFVQKGLPFLLTAVGLDASGVAANLSHNGHKMLAGAIAGGRYPNITQSIVSESGIETIVPAFTQWEMSLANFIYWFLIPGMQFTWAICVVDTWQYFLHRAMHLNRWLYGKK